MDAHDDEIRVVFGCDTQNLPIRLAMGKPNCRPAPVPYGVRNQLLKLRHRVPFAILPVLRPGECPGSEPILFGRPFKYVKESQRGITLLRERDREIQRRQ